MSSIFIKQKKVLKKVNIIDILFIKAEGDYCRIVLRHSTIVVKSSMINMEKTFGTKFLRVQRSYIVNLDSIESVDTTNKNIMFDNGSEIPFSPDNEIDLYRNLKIIYNGN